MDNKQLTWCLRQAHKYLKYVDMYTDIEEELDKIMDLRMKTYELLEVAEKRYENERKKGS